MNSKSLLITMVVAFVTVWATNFLTHGVWLSSTYGATKELWRPEAEMVAKMPWMLLGQFLVAAAFTVIFAACVAEKQCLSCTLKFSASIGVLTGAGQLITYAVQPFPGSLVARWFPASCRRLVLGLVVHKVYKLPAK